MKSEKEILEQVIQEAQKIEIPQSLQPENMRKKIEARGDRKKNTAYYKKTLLTAACMLLLLGTAVLVRSTGGREEKSASNQAFDSASALQSAGGAEAAPEAAEITAEEAVQEEEIPEGMAFGEAGYEEIYQSMLPQWESQYSDVIQNTARKEASTTAGSASFQEKQRAETDSAAAVEDLAAGVDYGSTNIQTAGVDEGDIIKNDGRYLYQVINLEKDGWQQAVQIVDTREGLTQISCLDGFQNIQEFYVRDDRLIIIENKYYPYSVDDSSLARKAMYDSIYRDNVYHEISFYDIKEKNTPRLLKKFTLEGEFTSSRIAGGYFYGFSRYYATPGEGKEDYQAYIPQVEGKSLEAKDILLPEGSKGTSYLVLVSVALENPTEFAETRAVVSSGDMYYVSGENIYVTSYKGAAEGEGWNSVTTDILRFSYGEGKFALRARGTIKGQLDSSFSLDEYNGHLRAVATVREYNMRKLTDSRTGKWLGYEILQEKKTNALYVLDRNLKVTGSIEGLAEDEQIYSARFLGERGYFVTFRQTDPLYAVDLSDPAGPKILSELKISGFSEYLHLYGKNRMLGIGMEADEETGVQKGMKLSMFDISDPTNVQEVSKLDLSKYDYSNALYNHRAVLISPEANIFGFEAESYQSRYQKKYLVFSYDAQKDVFVKEMELDTADADGNYGQTRGTFIGEVFYLLRNDGSVTSYDRSSGRKLDSLSLEE